MAENSGRSAIDSLRAHGNYRGWFIPRAEACQTRRLTIICTLDSKALDAEISSNIKRGKVVIFHIPAALREFAGGRANVEIEHEPAILNDVFIRLWQLYPGLRDRIMTEQGQVRTHINIFVGDENIRYLGGLAARVQADAVISIIPAVSGGVDYVPCSASSLFQVL